VLQLEASGAGVGIAWETDDGGWKPVVQMVSEGALEGIGGAGAGGVGERGEPSPEPVLNGGREQPRGPASGGGAVRGAAPASGENLF
jgi:hypothetical protein